MSHQIPSLGDKTNLRDIFRTLENQNSAIFNGDHDAYSASITACLKNLVELISPNDEYLGDLKYLITDGVCCIARNYESNRERVTPVVLNLLMTAIRSYNHIKGSSKASPRSRAPYHVSMHTCRGLSDMGTAFLVQVLAPYINSGARHVFPVDTPLEFNVRVKEKFSKTTTPPEGRVGSLSTAISFGEALKSLKKANKANKSPKKGNKTPTKGNKSPGNSSDTDSSGSRSGGKTRRHKHTLRRHSTRR
ncbi:MAG: hypothetical protein EBY22_12420 [Gammaproteobacteria bacterium]|uniref:Uncharacterized protein n=1 Tax=viral metagenome TaxID=1070528 RepID=A0A6C0I6Q2_9ZZZZ|nr:hypothetical protein [Gammaproteobacteria bacterium]